MITTFENIEEGARAKVNEWIGSEGRVLYVWADSLSSPTLNLWTYYVVAAVPGTLDPGLQFLRVWSISFGRYWRT
ncbi:MAG TPA: hypothetical protein VF297_05385 [Pyrinomonadaceae bacterium]